MLNSQNSLAYSRKDKVQYIYNIKNEWIKLACFFIKDFCLSVAISFVTVFFCLTRNNNNSNNYDTFWFNNQSNLLIVWI